MGSQPANPEHDPADVRAGRADDASGVVPIDARAGYDPEIRDRTGLRVKPRPADASPGRRKLFGRGDG